MVYIHAYIPDGASVSSNPKNPSLSLMLRTRLATKCRPKVVHDDGAGGNAKDQANSLVSRGSRNGVKQNKNRGYRTHVQVTQAVEHSIRVRRTRTRLAKEASSPASELIDNTSSPSSAKIWLRSSLKQTPTCTVRCMFRIRSQWG